MIVFPLLLIDRNSRTMSAVVYWSYNEGYPAILLWVFAKNEADDLSPSQKRQLVSASEAFTRQFRSVK